MSELVNNLALIYMNIGFTGVFIVCCMAYGLWYATKGKYKRQAKEKESAALNASFIEVLRNNTAVIENNSEVVRANTQQRQDEIKCLEKLSEKIDQISLNQTVCMDRQTRK